MYQKQTYTYKLNLQGTQRRSLFEVVVWGEYVIWLFL